MAAGKGKPRYRAGWWYAIERPDGRQGRRIFGSRYRAMEHAMRAARTDWWPDLASRGVRIVSCAPPAIRYIRSNV